VSKVPASRASRRGESKEPVLDVFPPRRGGEEAKLTWTHSKHQTSRAEEKRKAGRLSILWKEEEKDGPSNRRRCPAHFHA